MPRSISRPLSLALLVTMLGACGLTVTQDRPSFEQLEPHEQSVVQKVLAELRGFKEARRPCQAQRAS